MGMSSQNHIHERRKHTVANVNNEVINAIAQKYAETRSDDDFRELYEQLKPIIHNEAIKAERDRGIPRETMISHYTEGVWQAARGEAVKNFDGSSQFTQRVHEFFKRRLADEIRYRSYGKRKGQVESLDKLVPDRADHVTYGDTLSDSSSLEQDLTESEWIREALEGFTRSSESHGRIIKMILHGNTNEEMAAAFGSEKYDTRIRSLVKRARQSFRAYLEERKTLEFSG